MANILYGVNGEGSGHSTRAREVITHLQQQGHKLHIVSFDRGLRNLSESFAVTEIFGLSLTYVNNRVRYKRTLASNLIKAPRAVRSLKELSHLVDENKIDLVITDFEPLSCHVGHRKRLPVIAIDNQHAITNTRVTLPRGFKRDVAAVKLVTRMMTPHADAYLVLSFFPAPVKKRNTFIFPPILRHEVLSATPQNGDYVLVYVTSPAKELAALLKQVRCKFVAYGFGIEGQEDNILFKKPSMDGFLHDLTGAKAVIANAGFSLVSEALHLGKPYLAMPVKNQFEQTFNAYHVDRLGYGAWWKNLGKEQIESFLFNLPFYSGNLRTYPRAGNSAILAKVDELIGTLTAKGRNARN
ncbi:MAG TPA: glycosyltransferase family protein [Candidatus Polarisedimenticolia bacterium]|nr:glycosyltransferase family protein [Candidatus Polarisedimenticolia bacterium]